MFLHPEVPKSTSKCCRLLFLPTISLSPFYYFPPVFRRFLFSPSAVSQRFCLPPTQHYTNRAPKSSSSRMPWCRSALLRLIPPGLFNIGQPEAVKTSDDSVTLPFICVLKPASLLASALPLRPSLRHLSFKPTPRSLALCSPASPRL